MKNFTISKEEAEVLQMGLYEAWQIAARAARENPKDELTEEYVNKAEEVKRIADELGERLKFLFSPEPLNLISKSQAFDAFLNEEAEKNGGELPGNLYFDLWPKLVNDSPDPW